MSTTTIAPDKISAYLATHYCVLANDNQFTLFIDVPSNELSQLYFATVTATALFITAFNPFGQSLDEDANLVAHSRLGEHLRSLTSQVYEGHGRDHDGNWPAELSYLVLGLDWQTAEQLGRQVHQDAIVWASDDAVPRLKCLR